MSNFDDECILTLPQILNETHCIDYQQALLRLSENAHVIIDFQHISKADYHFLNTLLYMKDCLSDCLNTIHFINYSSEIRELFDEINLKQFLEISNLTH